MLSAAKQFDAVGFTLSVVRQNGRPDMMPLLEAGSLAAVDFGSDYGLCGRFNEGVTTFAVNELGRRLVPGERLRILAVGERAAERLEALGYSVDMRLLLPGSAKGLTATVETILVTLDDWRGSGGVAQAFLLHNRRQDQGAANPVIKQLLPVDMQQISDWALRPWPSRCLPTFTMDPIALLSSLVRQFLFMTLYRAAAESLASEHASRLTSMQTAERNIRERLEKMMREFRQMRQRLSVEELLDLVAGYEVLEGKPCRFSTSAGTGDELAVPFRIKRFVGNHAHTTVFSI